MAGSYGSASYVESCTPSTGELVLALSPARAVRRVVEAVAVVRAMIPDNW